MPKNSKSTRARKQNHPPSFRGIVRKALQNPRYAEYLQDLTLQVRARDAKASDQARRELARVFKLSPADLKSLALPAAVRTHLNRDCSSCTNPRTTNTTLALGLFVHFLPRRAKRRAKKH